MYDFVTGHKLASMICDDEEFFQAWVLGEITPFYKGIPQFYESSCPACVLATKNGQPDPFVCDTDPDPETYPELVPGCSRHSDCGFSPLDDVPRIVDRLKYLSFRVDDVERYFTETGTIPAIIAETFEETWELLRKAPFTYDPSLTEKKIENLQCYHLWRGN